MTLQVNRFEIKVITDPNCRDCLNKKLIYGFILNVRGEKNLTLQEIFFLIVFESGEGGER